MAKSKFKIPSLRKVKRTILARSGIRYKKLSLKEIFIYITKKYIYYRIGSIYSGIKDSSAIWLDEKLATGVNMIKVEGATQVSQIGFVANSGDTPTETFTVLAGETKYIRSTNSRVAWKSVTSATIDIEQSVEK